MYIPTYFWYVIPCSSFFTRDSFLEAVAGSVCLLDVNVGTAHLESRKLERPPEAKQAKVLK